jgi:hypothetical protein
MKIGTKLDRLERECAKRFPRLEPEPEPPTLQDDAIIGIFVAAGDRANDMVDCVAAALAERPGDRLGFNIVQAAEQSIIVGWRPAQIAGEWVTTILGLPSHRQVGFHCCGTCWLPLPGAAYGIWHHRDGGRWQAGGAGWIADCPGCGTARPRDDHTVRLDIPAISDGENWVYVCKDDRSPPLYEPLYLPFRPAWL